MSETGGGINFAELYARLDRAEAQLLADDEVSLEKRDQLLLARAKALAPSRVQSEENLLSLMVFRVAGGKYAIPLDELDQVLECKNLCALPGAPNHVLGALAVRTRIVPVLDLRVLLGMSAGGLSDLEWVVILHHNGETFGLAAEDLEGAQDIPQRLLLPPKNGPFRWVTAQGLAVLDPARLGTSDAEAA